MGNEKIKKFLRPIRKVESSNGKNFDSKVIESGIHAGDRAIGNYQLMPNTVREVLTRLRRSGKSTAELEELKKQDSSTLKDTLEKRPDLEEPIAEKLAEHILSRQPDEEKAAYMWNHGHNMKDKDFKDVDYKNSDYVKKYNKAKTEDGEE